MSIVKIQNVNRLKQAIDYIKQDTKTNGNLVTTFDCYEDFIIEDFNSLYEDRKFKLDKDTKNKAKMIIQSFEYDENITPDQAHEIGKKLADNYLKGNHQYIIATHTDTNYLHNHIIFNQVRSDNLLMYDTSRKNTIINLRNENDKLSKEYNLTIYDNKTNKKTNYISQREVEVRRRGKSFKEDLENTIDKAIEESFTYEDFIKNMEALNFKSKRGKHLAFLNKKTDRFMRTKTLGINYTENSIKYRIENKDFKIYKFDYTIKKQAIDLSQEKFKKNYGLRKWGVKQNIAYLQEISHLIFNEKKSLEEIKNIDKTEREFVKDIENTIQNKDNILYDIEKKAGAYQDYKDSASLIAEYKKSDNKQQFKKENYQGFKKFDNAKKNMNLLRKDYNINSFEELLEYKNIVSQERDRLYSNFTKLQNYKDKTQEQEVTKERKKEKERNSKIIRH